MGDVLSQSEIDALLAAMASGNFADATPAADECTVLETVSKFTDINIQDLECIHKEYANLLSSTLYNSLNAKIALVSIQELRYEELIRSLPCPTVLTVFKLTSLDGCFLFETNPDLMFEINPNFSESKDLPTGFSEKQKNSALKISKDFIECLERTWNMVMKTKSKVDYLETDPNKLKLLENEASVALLSFSLSLNNLNTFFNICIPYSSIESHLDDLKIKYPLNTTVSSTVTRVMPQVLDYKLDLSNNFTNTNLNIKVVLDTLQLSLGEMMNFKKGSVLNTHKKYKNKVAVLVEEKHCFNGEIGLISNRKAIKIVDCLEGDV